VRPLLISPGDCGGRGRRAQTEAVDVLEQMPWGWLGAITGAVLVALMVTLLVWARGLRRRLESLQDQVRDAVRAVWQSEASMTRASMVLERHVPAGDGTGELALPEPERQQLARWIAAGQQLVGLVRDALADYEAARRESAAARHECERLRRELAQLQGEHDRLLRERKELAQALATFVHEAGPRALLEPPGAAGEGEAPRDRRRD
jgi:hypothetical protein